MNALSDGETQSSKELCPYPQLEAGFDVYPAADSLYHCLLHLGCIVHNIFPKAENPMIVSLALNSQPSLLVFGLGMRIISQKVLFPTTT